MCNAHTLHCRFQVRDKAAMLKLVADGPNASDQIIDARPAGRFEGTVPEPRAGLRGGHMPGAPSIIKHGVLD